ncbi:hypothetical protein [Kutzneria buriramensis]|uniref:Uncharacterized protein n=1 Tax=Kutzneria buriramensis TaxID=1045776 RepID=A0A3E0HD64_9PSEU|nr:hypothetical protein [Kutzneria buriramensis]REH42733.1 hypothetical protein BCF44_110230 [Kutzneria buriramensis]
MTTDLSQADRAAVGLLYLGVLIAWASVAAGIAFVRLYTWLDNLPPHTTKQRITRTVTADPTTTPNDNSTPGRPRPVRKAAAIIGGLTALISGLVGSGLITDGQGGALTGLIAAVVALLGAFGFVASSEGKVTPLSDPHDNTGTQLVPATIETEGSEAPTK